MNRRAMTKHYLHTAALAILATLALNACSAAPTPPTEAPPLAGAAIGGPFTLVDKTNRTVRWDDLRGKYAVVYFGYAFCPDVCPTDVAAMMQGYALFAKSEPALAAKIQPIFITIDPARDTPAVVGEFTAAFSPKLLGLTGTQAQIKQAADGFKAYYAKGKQSAGGYLMDHSRAVYLFDRDGKPLVTLPVDKGGEAVASDLAAVVH